MDKETKDKSLDFSSGAASSGTITINDNSDTVVTGVSIPVTKMASSITEEFDLGAHTKALSINTQKEEAAAAGNPKLLLASADASVTITQGMALGSEALGVSTDVPGHHVDYSLTGEGGITFTAQPDEE